VRLEQLKYQDHVLIHVTEYNLVVEPDDQLDKLAQI
jgi:hypothetical protein